MCFVVIVKLKKCKRMHIEGVVGVWAECERVLSDSLFHITKNPFPFTL